MGAINSSALIKAMTNGAYGGGSQNTSFNDYSKAMQSNYGYTPRMDEYIGSLSDGTLDKAMEGAGGGLLDYFSMDNFGDSMKGLGGLGSLATGLYGIYQGNKMLDMYEHQIEQSDEKWGLQKEELTRLQGVRGKNESRMTEMEADPNSMYYRG